jgi:hypothetical protein
LLKALEGELSQSDDKMGDLKKDVLEELVEFIGLDKIKDLQKYILFCKETNEEGKTSFHWPYTGEELPRELLEKYISPLLPWQEACQLFLRLLRQSGEAKDVVAHNGSFQQAPSGKVYQLMRIAVEDDTLFSEISANKYLLSVRFLKSERDKKAQIVNADVPFKITLCQL